MGDETNATRPSGTSQTYSGASGAVRSVMAAMLSCWPNTKFDRKDTTGVWSNAIAELRSDQIRHGIRQLSLTAEAFPPSPGQFRALCISYRPAEPAPAPVQRVLDLSAHTRAWRACQVAFSKKVCGLRPPGPVPETDFDVEYVVASAPKPTSSSLLEHEHAWAKLKANFEREWTRLSAGVGR